MRMNHTKTPVVASNVELNRSFYERDTHIVARELLGKELVHYKAGNIRAGIIVETEAYDSHDPACHAYRGKTKRNYPLFGPVGHAYIYFIYGNHYCLNVVARNNHVKAGGVLIRAIEPTQGVTFIEQARHPVHGYHLSNGPGKLTQALGITKLHNTIDFVTSDELYITEGQSIESSEIITSARIGLSIAQDAPLRFFINNNPWVSKTKHVKS